MIVIPNETAFKVLKWNNNPKLQRANSMMINKLTILKVSLITLPSRVLVRFASARQALRPKLLKAESMITITRTMMKKL